jgi:hypothetical protein
MRGFAIALAVVGMVLSGCASSPKETVLNLDTTDRKWVSGRCVAARKAVARYDDHKTSRGVVRVVGNLVAPFAGTATSLALNAAQDDERERLNHRVRAACISDPLKGKRPGKVPKARYARS